ncbi:Zn-ribbon domain-containing OB-fold protein [Amycolatopsis eburnea]|uniref:Zn-ribbon domain-containing OB-fold protein n=1 Tax=Amycolatopsis eburnea TaxID=2267691 RepID=UPI001CDC9E7D|nr:OB-fold domain-containing protein [Amycolatopsis eburnea]
MSTVNGEPGAERVRHHLDGLREREIRIIRCAACGRAQFPPRSACPSCHAPGPFAWERASGQATIWSFCVFHKAYLPPPAPQPPYTVAVVELAEGPRLVTNIVDADPHTLRIGDALEPVFGPGGAPEVRFRPRRADR